MALDWHRGHGPNNPASLARLAGIIDAVSRHVQDQIRAFAEQPGLPLPAYRSLTDLLIGAYVLGLLDSCVRKARGAGPAMSEDQVRATVLRGMEEVCLRVLGPERTRWVRHQLPPWEGPPAYHPAFRRELMRMAHRGAHDGAYLAADDPLCFAKASSLLSFMMGMLAAPSRIGRPFAKGGLA
jgi:hypothetical protein